MVNMILSRINLWRAQNKSNFSLIINYLFISYAFFIPISAELTKIIFNLILIIYFLDTGFKNKILQAFRNSFIQAIILFYFMHILWLFSVDNMDFAYSTIENSRFLIYVIIYITSIRQDFIFKILNSFLISMMFSELVSYLIFFNIIDPINNATMYNPVPFVLSHTQYAVYLSIAMGIMLYVLLKEKHNKFIQAVYFLFFISASINIFIISSRLGFILYAVNIVFISIYIYRKELFKFIGIALSFLFIGYFLAYKYSPTFKNRLDQTINSFNKVLIHNNYHTSLGTRLGYWIYSCDIIKDNLLFGVGDGDHIKLVKENILRSDKNSSNTSALLHSMQGGLHSDFLNILVKFGLVGLFIYFNIFYQLYRHRSKNNMLRALQLLLILSFILSGLQGGTIMLKDLGKLFTLLGALTVVNSIKEPLANSNPTK
jgi:O-antigen ligase